MINIGRGDLLTEASVVEALEAGWLHAAVLDVLPSEPLPPESTLWTRDDVFITPHVSAVSFPSDVVKVRRSRRYAMVLFA